MRLKVLGSGSKGNCYLLYNQDEALMLEAGVPFKEVLTATGGRIDKIVACLVTHEHGDHAKYVKDMLEHGILTLMTSGTKEYLMGNMRLKSGYDKPIHVTVGKQFTVGGFTVLPFETWHDAAEPCGYMIHHKEMGTLVFATDTVAIPNTFEGVNNIIIECNYDEHLLAAREDIPESLKDRIRHNHMSVDTCIEALKANDLRQVNNIVLAHISEGDGDAQAFEVKVSEAVGKTAWAAVKGMTIDFDKTPF